MSPERACEIAVARGLDALLFTEHGMYWAQHKLDALQNSFPRLKLFTGIEIALDEGYHVVAFGRRIVDLPTPVISLAELNALTHEFRQDVFLFVAHAFRYQPCPMPSLPVVLDFCDGLEMNSINILRGHAVQNGARILPGNNALYLQQLQKYHLTPLYNTDGHDEDIIGLISNEFPINEPPADEVGLAHLFKSVHPSEFQCPEQLSRHSLINSPEQPPHQVFC